MKTITVREELYKRLVKLKREGESFSDVIERLLDRPRKLAVLNISNISLDESRLRDCLCLTLNIEK